MKKIRYARVGATVLALLALGGCASIRQHPKIWGTALTVAVVAGAAVAVAESHHHKAPSGCTTWACALATARY